MDKKNKKPYKKYAHSDKTFYYGQVKLSYDLKLARKKPNNILYAEMFLDGANEVERCKKQKNVDVCFALLDSIEKDKKELRESVKNPAYRGWYNGFKSALANYKDKDF